MNGYQDALKKNGKKPDDILIIYFNEDEVKNKKNIQKLLKEKNKPDGIFASVEKLAIYAYEICAELKLNIPKDIKIISFSNLQTAALLNPSLTTIAQPAYEIGREAASILFKLIEKRGFNFLPERTVIKSKLIKRKSTKGERAGK